MGADSSPEGFKVGGSYAELSEDLLGVPFPDACVTGCDQVPGPEARDESAVQL